MDAPIMRVGAGLALLLLLSACGSASSTAANPTASPTPSAAASPSPAESPTPIPTPSPTPVASPSPSPSASPSACQTVQGGTAARAIITDVRVGSHPGYDRLVIQFSGGLPAYKLAPQDPSTFIGPASGIPIPVAGTSGFHLYIYQMDIPPTYPYGNLSPAYSVLKQVVVMAVFEGQADIAIGLGAPVCPKVSIYASPDRLVIDFPTQ
jgi:hypothetical protein